MHELSDEDLARAASVRPEDGPALFFLSQLLDFVIDGNDPSTFAQRAGIAGNGAEIERLRERIPPELLAAADRQ